MSEMEEAYPSLFTTELVVTATVLPIVATTAVALRFRSRVVARIEHKGDDWAILLALVLAWVMSLLTFLAVAETGINYYDNDKSIADNVKFSTMLLWFYNFFALAALGAIKVSALLFYMRIFVTPRFRLAAKIAVAFIVVYTLILMLLAAFVTTPLKAFWTEDPVPYNYDYSTYATAWCGINIFLDTALVIFPLPEVLKLRLPAFRKLQVYAVFSLAAFCVAASCLRFYFSFKANTQVAASAITSTSIVMLRTALLWLHIEISVSIIAICLPTLSVLFSRRGRQRSIQEDQQQLMSLTGAAKKLVPEGYQSDFVTSITGVGSDLEEGVSDSERGRCPFENGLKKYSRSSSPCSIVQSIAKSMDITDLKKNAGGEYLRSESACSDRSQKSEWSQDVEQALQRIEIVVTTRLSVESDRSSVIGVDERRK